MSPVRAIPTSFAGVTFRSRLEADWAYHLSSLGIAWSYEPEGVQLPSGERYLPDFWLPEANTWLEVKGPGVPGLGKTEELVKALITDSDSRWIDSGVVIARPAHGATTTYEVACPFCRTWVKSSQDARWNYNGASAESCLSRTCDFRGFVTYHDACGMESRCWTCGEKTYPLDSQLQPDRFWRLPRTHRDRQARTDLENLFNGKAAS